MRTIMAQNYCRDAEQEESTPHGNKRDSRGARMAKKKIYAHQFRPEKGRERLQQ